MLEKLAILLRMRIISERENLTVWCPRLMGNLEGLNDLPRETKIRANYLRFEFGKKGYFTEV